MPKVLLSGLKQSVVLFAILAFAQVAYGASDRESCEAGPDTGRPISACDAAIAASPNDETLYLLRGSAFSANGNYERAIADLSQAIHLNPRYEAAYAKRAIAFRIKGDINQSIADFATAIDINPSGLTNYIGRGFGLWTNGEFEKSIDDFNKAIALDPNYAGAYLVRAQSYRELKQFDAAVLDANQAIELNQSEGYRSRALTRIQLQDYDGALADINEAITRNPKLVFNFVTRGTIWRLKGDLDAALRDLDQAVALQPANAPAHYARADVLRYRGNFDEALTEYQVSLRYAPNNTPALTGLGLTYERLGNLVQARLEFEAALNSPSEFRFTSDSRAALETAKARLAAYSATPVQPRIVPPPVRASNEVAIPTGVASLPQAIAVKSTARRVALVIGNSAYANVPALVNPEKDAKAVAATLRTIGFEVVTLEDNDTREKLVGALRAFANEAENSDWAMVYYAGHGMEVGGVNYLVPVDAKIAVDRDIQSEAVPLDQVLAAVDGAKKLKLIMLDACRDNPFKPRATPASAQAAVASSTAGAPIASRSIGRGLADVKVSGATLVVYAAKGGQVALDGEGGNSPFAVAVVQRLATPGVEITKLFRLVRDDVMEATAGRQEPYTYGSLPGKEDFFFVVK